MIRPRLYLDTSVPSAFFDDRAPDRQRLTQRFWREQLQAYKPVLSDLVLEEISKTPDPHRRAEILHLVEPLEIATRREVNLVNALGGFQPVEIVAPPEL